jgi:hypothetical protein
MSEDYYPTMPTHAVVPHYYGDAVRILFVAAAVVILFGEFFDATFPLPLGLALIIIAALVVIAGITNPVQIWIQWVNVVSSFVGLALFGDIALVEVHMRMPFAQSIYPGLVTLIFLASLYFGTRTLRGLMIHRSAIME